MNKTDYYLAIEPWNLSVEEREQVFINTKKNNKKIALYYARKPDSSTFRYRCYNTFQATLNSKKWQAVCFYRNELEILERLIPESDLIVLGRQSRWDGVIKKIIENAHKNNLKVAFDLDDLVFDEKYMNTVLNTIGETNLDYWLPYFMDINKTSANANGFLVTNNYLGELISDCFNKPYKVIRNSLNREQLDASVVYSMMKNENKKNFIIGYFSGSPTHKNDLDVALPEILDFLRKHKNAKLRVVGCMTFDEKAREFIENGQIEFVPPVDFRKLQRLMAEVDVNIAPLVMNDFTNCKSELKFFEAAAVETTTIASPTYTFKNAIIDGKNGFLAQQGEWYDKLEYLYQNPEENQKIAKEAKRYALRHYYGEEFLKEVEKAYDYFAK